MLFHITLQKLVLKKFSDIQIFSWFTKIYIEGGNIYWCYLVNQCMVEIREGHPLTSAWDVAYLLITMPLVIFSCYLCLLFSNPRMLQNEIYSCNKHVLHLFLCIYQWQWRQWSTELPERNTNILLKIARESTSRRLINQCNLAKCCILEQTLLFSSG